MGFSYIKQNINGSEYFCHRQWDGILKKEKRYYAKTLSELKRKVSDADRTAAYGLEDCSLTLGDFISKWLYNVHMVDKKPSTKTRYDSIFNNHVKPARAARIKIKDLKPSDIQEWYNDVFEKSTESRVKSIQKIVRPALRYAVLTGVIIRNPADLIVMPKNKTARVKKKKVNPMTLNEQKAFIKAAKSSRYEALFNTAVDTGMRSGELRALTWRDIDFEKDIINIDKTYSYIKDYETKKFVGLTTPPKSEASIRKIPLPRRVKRILIEHKNKQRDQAEDFGLEWSEDTLVFCTPILTHLDEGNVLHEIKKVYERASIEGKCFHDLRHTYATRLLELREIPKVIQDLLGHSELATTMNTYAHVLSDTKERAISKIDSLYD